MRDKTFNEIWELHKKWSVGLLYNGIQNLKTAEIFTSTIPEAYFNFAIPLVGSPNNLDLQEISTALYEKGHKSAVNLFEDHQHSGFVERVVREGFTLESRDSYLLFDKKTYGGTQAQDSVVREIGLDEFGKFRSIIEEAFEFFTGNKQYGDMEEGFLKGVRRSAVSDLQLKLYLIDDNGKSVAAGALFYSQAEHFGYLHDAGVRKAYRGKGYQSALIRKRIDVCLDKGIERVYVSAEHGGTSWRNCIRNGFKQIQTILTFTKKGNVQNEDSTGSTQD